MTAGRASLIDAYLLRPGPTGPEVLVLRRAAGGRSPGSWEGVHGHIEAGETPAATALREIHEETGLTPDRLYNVSRVESFYLPQTDTLALIPVFVAWVRPEATVVLSEEHDRLEWIPVAEAASRFSWPRAARAVEDAMRLVGEGTAGPLEDVLRVR